MSDRTRRHFTPQQKAEIVRRHLVGKEPVSALAEEFGVQPSQIHGLVNQVLARTEAAFQRTAGAGRGQRRKDERTSPYYPQSNGKIERWHKSLKGECIRPVTPLSLDDARRLVERFVTHYNTVRLHSAIGYVTPADKLLGLEVVIHAERDRKLEEAREVRRLRRQRQPAATPSGKNASPVAKPAEAIDFRHLRGQVTIQRVLDEIGYLASMTGVGPQRRGPCPLHDEPHQRRRSFSVHLGKGVFRCFHPACQAQGNVLDLWARHTGLPLREAAVDMASRFGVAARPGTREEEPVTAACHRRREPVS